MGRGPIQKDEVIVQVGARRRWCHPPSSPNWVSATPWSPNLLRTRHKHRGSSLERARLLGASGPVSLLFWVPLPLSLSPRDNPRMSMSLPPSPNWPSDRTIQTGIGISIPFTSERASSSEPPPVHFQKPSCVDDTEEEFTHTRIANEFRDCREWCSSSCIYVCARLPMNVWRNVRGGLCQDFLTRTCIYIKKKERKGKPSPGTSNNHHTS